MEYYGRTTNKIRGCIGTEVVGIRLFWFRSKFLDEKNYYKCFFTTTNSHVLETIKILEFKSPIVSQYLKPIKNSNSSSTRHLKVVVAIPYIIRKTNNSLQHRCDIIQKPNICAEWRLYVLYCLRKLYLRSSENRMFTNQRYLIFGWIIIKKKRTIASDIFARAQRLKAHQRYRAFNLKMCCIKNAHIKNNSVLVVEFAYSNMSHEKYFDIT